MIKTSFVLLMLTAAFAGWGQAGKVPPFRMVQRGGTIFKAENLPMGKPIILIYFSPDCDHCDKLMKDMLKSIADFKNASVAMITYLPLDRVKAFVHRYNLHEYPNIYVGTEGTTFFVKDYFHITEMPFMALYSKNGDLVKVYAKQGFLHDLTARLNHLH